MHKAGKLVVFFSNTIIVIFEGCFTVCKILCVLIQTKFDYFVLHSILMQQNVLKYKLVKTNPYRTIQVSVLAFCIFWVSEIVCFAWVVWGKGKVQTNRQKRLSPLITWLVYSFLSYRQSKQKSLSAVLPSRFCLVHYCETLGNVELLSAVKYSELKWTYFAINALASIFVNNVFENNAYVSSYHF